MSHGPEGPSNTRLQKTTSKFLLGTRYLCSNDQRQYTYSKVGRVVPYKLRSRFLYQAHNCINHSGITRMRTHLASYGWEYKNRDIEGYIESCEICVKRKGNYGKHRHWPTGHCKRRKRSFDIINMDFVSMPISKGKRCILTILDSFSCHLNGPFLTQETVQLTPLEDFTASSFACRKYHESYLLTAEPTSQGGVYKNFCDRISITRELHCPWRPQSSSNIERQHRAIKNALFMLCEDRNREWTDILESTTSSMNATINSATGVWRHWVITGR